MAQITRLADSGSQAGKVDRIAAVTVDHSIVTAVRDSSQNLKLISWSGTTRTGDSGNQAGTIKEVDIISQGFLVTAVVTGGGRLKLVSWEIMTNSDPATFTRLGDSGSQAGAASRISLARVPTQSALRQVTALRASNGRLKVVAWDLKTDKSFERLGDSGDQAGTVSRVQVAAPNQNLVVTAVRTSEGKLKLVTWSLSDDGNTITRVADSGDQAGEVTEIAMSPDATVTAVKTSSGNLKLVRWSIAPDGTTIERIGDSGNQAGAASSISLWASNSGGHYVTGLKAGSGNLKLVSWDAGANGSITRTADSGNQAGTTSTIASVNTIALAMPISSSAPLLSAVRDSDGDLKVISWDVDF